MQELNECQRLEEPFRHEADAKEERAIVTEYGNSVFERVTEQIRRQPSLELGNFLRVRSGERLGFIVGAADDASVLSGCRRAPRVPSSCAPRPGAQPGRTTARAPRPGATPQGRTTRRGRELWSYRD